MKFFNLLTKLPSFLLVLFLVNFFCGIGLMASNAYGFETVLSKVKVLKLHEVKDSRFQGVLQALKKSDQDYEVVKENNVDRLEGGTLFLPLPNTLTDKALSRLESYLNRGGKLVLVAPEENPDMNTFKLFSDIKIPLAGSAYVPQTQEMLWQEAILKNTRDANVMVKDYLPVGSKVLVIDESKGVQLPAFWGETYPALARSDKGAFINWDWGKALSAKTNNTILTYLLDETSFKTYAEAVVNQSKTQATKTAVNTETQSPVPGDTPEEKPKVDYGAFYKKLRDVEDYKRFVYNNIESALQLSDTVDVKKAEQYLAQADIYKAQFESKFMAGNPNEAELDFEKAKQLLLNALVLASPSSRVEGRAIWLDRGSIVASGSPEGLRKVFKKLDQAGINIVYFETVNAGFPIYPSKLLPSNPLVTDWDPLKVAVEEGHKLGMEVHAWVWCFAVGNKKHNDVIYKNGDYPGPILSEKGLMSEALRMSNGGMVPNRQTEFWLSPASPKARDFLKSVYSEIVTNYNVDGLQLDYIRYPFQHSGSYMGYEGVGRSRFEAETGLSLSVLDENTLKTWAAWKAHQVSTFVKDVSVSLKTIRPSLKLSAAVFPMKRAERIMAIQQDWETWVDKGWIDTLSPMSYTTSPDELQKTIENLSHYSEKKIILYPGIAVHRMDSVELLNMLQAARRKGSMGSTIFAMAHLDDTKVGALGQGPYKEKRPMAPHRDPVKSATMLLQDFQGQFNKLATTKTLEVLTPADVQTFQ
ncbi:MAG: family 10 glycosylhydrolase, partial [Cyanobacteria bacterium]|nr:family 10 glycosylhydrolase [Cyanobacteriota bacterium]